MGHGLTETDQMFSVRQPAWHRLGVVLGDYPTRAEAQQLAHPWEPITEPLYRRVLGPGDSPVFTEVPEQVAVVRSDTRDVLGTVAPTFELITNSEMYDIAEAIERAAADGDTSGEDPGQVKFETAGSLHGGRQVWLLLRLAEPLVVPGDEGTVTIPYYALQNGHTGTSAFRGQAVATRIVCANTSQLADWEAKDRGTEFTFKHTRNVRARVEEARAALQSWRTDLQEWLRLVRLLTLVPVTEAQQEEFVETFVPMPPPGTVSQRVVTNVQKAQGEVLTILRGRTTAAVAPTAYGLIQAAVEYQCHYRGTRGDSDRARDEARFRRSYLTTSSVTRDAVTLALRAAGVDRAALARRGSVMFAD